MKGLSIVFALGLLVLAHQLARLINRNRIRLGPEINRPGMNLSHSPAWMPGGQSNGQQSASVVNLPPPLPTLPGAQPAGPVVPNLP